MSNHNSKISNILLNQISTTSLNELQTEAEQLFSLLDEYSSYIKSIEDRLNEAKLYIDFESACIPKKASGLYIEFLHKASYWYFSWSTNGESKQYRLFLVGTKDTLGMTIVEKKPLIETPLAVRIHMCEHLDSFIKAFTRCLQDYRERIKDSQFVGFQKSESPLQDFIENKIPYKATKNKE